MISKSVYYMVIDAYIQSMAPEKLNFYSIFAHNLYRNIVNMDEKIEF